MVSILFTCMTSWTGSTCIITQFFVFFFWQEGTSAKNIAQRKEKAFPYLHWDIGFAGKNLHCCWPADFMLLWGIYGWSSTCLFSNILCVYVQLSSWFNQFLFVSTIMYITHSGWQKVAILPDFICEFCSWIAEECVMNILCK